MAATVTDTLTATVRTQFAWNRTETQTIGTLVNRKSTNGVYQITDGDGPGEADLVFADRRTIPAGTVEEFDLLDLEQTALLVNVPYEFRQLRAIKVVNTETAPGRRLLVGVDPGRPTVVYAAEVGPGSEWSAVNYVDAWVVTEENNLLRIANPNAAAVTYELYLIGTSVAASGGSGSGG